MDWTTVMIIWGLGSAAAVLLAFSGCDLWEVLFTAGAFGVILWAAILLALVGVFR